MNNLIFTQPIDQIYDDTLKKDNEEMMIIDNEQTLNFSYSFMDQETEDNEPKLFKKPDQKVKPKFKPKSKKNNLFKYHLKPKWDEKIYQMKSNSFLLMKQNVTRHISHMNLIRQYLFSRLCELIKYQLLFFLKLNLKDKKEKEIIGSLSVLCLADSGNIADMMEIFISEDTFSFL